jgi:peptidoglycan/LPS O-acetylase OafA/YrhL
MVLVCVAISVSVSVLETLLEITAESGIKSECPPVGISSFVVKSSSHAGINSALAHSLTASFVVSCPVSFIPAVYPVVSIPASVVPLIPSSLWQGHGGDREKKGKDWDYPLFDWLHKISLPYYLA